ncbi:MAG: hypothetical protein Q7S32_03395 [bacterium]|nr:hypothetical protein [bacterium]
MIFFNRNIKELLDNSTSKHIPGQKFEPTYDKEIRELSLLELKQYITAWNNHRKERLKALNMDAEDHGFKLGEVADYVIQISRGGALPEELLENYNFVTAQAFLDDYDAKRGK